MSKGPWRMDPPWSGPLRFITGLRLEHYVDRVDTMRGIQRHRRRRFLINLECGHEQRVPFGRRPHIGRRTRCLQCHLGNTMETQAEDAES